MIPVVYDPKTGLPGGIVRSRIENEGLKVINDTSPLAHMERGDLGIGAVPMSLDEPNAKFSFGFHSHRSVPAESLDPLVKGLVHFMSLIPGAVVVEKTTPAN